MELPVHLLRVEVFLIAVCGVPVYVLEFWLDFSSAK